MLKNKEENILPKAVRLDSVKMCCNPTL